MKSISVGLILLCGIVPPKAPSAEPKIPPVVSTGNSLGESGSSNGGPPRRPIETEAGRINGGEERQRALIQVVTLLRRKLRSDERVLKNRESEAKHKWEEVVELEPVLSMASDNIDDARGEIERSYDARLESQDANETGGWYSRKRTPRAERLRQQALATKAAATKKLEEIGVLRANLETLRDRVAKLRDQTDVLDAECLSMALERARAAGVSIPSQIEQAAKSK